MNELIQVAGRQIGSETIQTVNARDLHAFLEVGKDFSTWIKDRVSQYGFAEGQDYVTAQELSTPKSGSAMSRPQRTVAYYLSLDMGKELAMVERNEKGKQARQYFIECERRSKAMTDPMHVLSDPAAMRGLLLTYSEKVLSLEAENEAMKPKVAALDRIATPSDGSYCIREAAKMLQVREKQLYQFLNERKWIYRHPMGKSWLAHAPTLRKGYMEHKHTEGDKEDGSRWTSTQARITSAGLARLSMLLTQEQFNAEGMLV